MHATRFDLSLFESLNEEYASKRVATPLTTTDAKSSRAVKRAERVAKIIPLAGKTVLDLGCGRGELARALVEVADCEVIAVDIAAYPDWTEAPRARIQYLACDLSEPHQLAPGSIDAIVSFSVMEHVRRPVAMLEACRRLLSPTGRFLLVAHLYRSATGSHRSREVFFPWPHLLFDDSVFEAFYQRAGCPPQRPAWLNKLTYADYFQVFDMLGYSVAREWPRVRELDHEFVQRFPDELGQYGWFDLRANAVEVLLDPVAGKEAVVARQARLDRRLSIERPLRSG